MVSGKLLLTDFTHILANAAKEKREIIEVPDTPSEYVRKLDREALEAGLLDEPVTYPEKTKTVPLVCLRYELNTTGKGRKCGLFSLFGCDFFKGYSTWGYLSTAPKYDGLRKEIFQTNVLSIHFIVPFICYNPTTTRK